MTDPRFPRPVISGCRRLLPVLAVMLLLAGRGAEGAPVFGETVLLTQPDGARVTVRAWGDEYHQRLEDLAGYTLVRDPDDGRLCYARLTLAGDAFESTGVPAGAPVPAGLAPGLRLPGDVVAAKVLAAQQAAGRLPADGNKSDYPIPAVTGSVRGIALLVDFGDEPAVLTPEQVEAHLNEPGYSDFGNNGSVRDYYADVSGGRLDLTHEVTPFYYRAAHPKSYYEDPAISAGWRARELVTEALDYLNRRGFDFSGYDANGDGFVDLVSCFYAGAPGSGHGFGLWPQAGDVGFMADGVTVRLWQISPLRDELSIGVACHEIGHALMQWPDLYDIGFESWGAGLFCLMSNPGAYRNPLQPCGPLKYRSGWTQNVLLDGVMAGQEAPVDGNVVFLVPHPEISNELYILENRQRSGRDEFMPDEGLAVWHVDWRGDNSREAMLPDIHYMVTLVQADGRWDLERDANWGDDTDLFGGDGYTTFNPDTSPPARWWRGQDANLFLDSISGPGPVVTFDFRDGIGRWPVQLTVEPAALPAPWRISGADGYIKTGTGTRLVHVPDEGSYVVTWRDAPGWQAPPSAAVYVPEAGPVPEVEGVYTHPPFAQTAVPALDHEAAGRGGQALDVDADGDLDLFVWRDGEGDLLLRNDGGWQFTDATPWPLAEPARTLAAAWADVDGDGDQDVYVVRDGADLLLRQTSPGTFAGDVERASAVDDSTRGAVWIDHDGDGWLDLHLVREGEGDLILRAPGAAAGLAGYQPLSILPGLSFSRTVGGSWCDYDANGRLDLYMVNAYGANVLARNELPAHFVDRTHGGLGLPYRSGAATWGDHDGDGDFDLYVSQDGAADVLFNQYDGIFVMSSEPQTDTPGAGRDAVWADFDNDGDLDLYLARRNEPDRLLMNQDGQWREASMLLPVVDGPSMAAVVADYDADGGLDLALVRDGEPSVMLRNTMFRGHWLQIDPVGYGGLREPVGSVMRLYVGDRVLLRHVPASSGPSRRPPRVHFGLGAATHADSLQVLWPDGRTSMVRSIEADQVLAVHQPTPGGTGGGEVPAVTTLLPAWPNPFNPGTNIAFDLARPGRATVRLYDVAGRLVRTLADDDFPVGRHTVRWEGADGAGRPVAAGVYLARFQADGVTRTIRLALVR
jgi:M6 family metalloprotease-like protein